MARERGFAQSLQRYKEAQKAQTHNQYLLCFGCVFVALKLLLSTLRQSQIT